MGFFIVLEGLDGAGITTQARLLAEALRRRGESVLLTKEPTEREVGQLIRRALRREVNITGLALQLLFMADRAQHLKEEILPFLARGTVVCDRYLYSTIAFGSLEADEAYLMRANEPFRRPDLAILLDAEPSACQERLRRAGRGLELFEDEGRARRVREAFLRLAARYGEMRVVDANPPIQEVASKVLEAALELWRRAGSEAGRRL